MRDTELVKYVKTIAERAATIPVKLTANGITAAIVSDLAAKEEGYNTAISAKESSIVYLERARGTMGDLFNEVDELFTNEVYRFMELLRNKEPEFYNKYFAAREVKATGVRHKSGEPEETKNFACSTTTGLICQESLRKIQFGGFFDIHWIDSWLNYWEIWNGENNNCLNTRAYLKNGSLCHAGAVEACFM